MTAFISEQARLVQGGAIYTGNPVEKDGTTITATGALAKLLFEQYVLPLEIVSVLLLAAVVGGVFLAMGILAGIAGGISPFAPPSAFNMASRLAGDSFLPSIATASPFSKSMVM